MYVSSVVLRLIIILGRVIPKDLRAGHYKYCYNETRGTCYTFITYILIYYYKSIVSYYDRLRRISARICPWKNKCTIDNNNAYINRYNTFIKRFPRHDNIITNSRWREELLQAALYVIYGRYTQVVPGRAPRTVLL